jgi:hypothetical protein
MTLVMTAITRRHVVQLADMRLTNMRTGQVADEATAKMVAYLDRFTFAFTGPACIGRTPSADWIAAVLRGVADPEAAPAALARAADWALARYEPDLRRYSIVGGGWLGPIDRPRPVYLEITNWDEPTISFLPRSRATVRELGRGERVRLFWAGVTVEEGVRAATIELMRRRAGRRDERPADLLAAMVRAARIVALSHPTVGRREFLASTIPSASRPVFAKVGRTVASGPIATPRVTTVGTRPGSDALPIANRSDERPLSPCR